MKIVVLARLTAPHVEHAWRQLQPVIDSHPHLQVLAIDPGTGIDLSRLDPELVVVLGGDGAILRACRQMGARQLPILGVNLGRLGFLADLALGEVADLLPTIAAREYEVVDHLMYTCAVSTGPEPPRERFLGLNEVVISAGASFHMLDVHLEIDGQPVTTYSGDGLIVSTPVGSTAHSLSAGGPILRQDLQAFVITPICPHTLTVRPLVDSADCRYTLTVPEAPPGARLIVDGQIQVPLTAADRVEVQKAPVHFQLARVPGHNYYHTLHRKLGWAGQPRYRQS